ncbi:MAG: 1-deoxy-D-xylulose-5-phosphate synthase [Thermodesulfovibrionales bacterium]|nr:1-deoxy-D-xylulose-5-phosphate synthase [Thermodesulfovibrionales bacterium]
MEGIEFPEDLRKLPQEELDGLASELRRAIINGVSTSGGHLASNLGVVELSIALHYVFDTPSDRIIWDVGHQSYGHKLLTGRKGRFHTLRKYKGISGFPKVSESAYDAFGTGHSSTSISAATGLIEARDAKGEKYKVIAVIGDGAMTAGLAFEGLNHAGQLGKDLIVVLNDNEMSISKNVGALSAYLNRILTGDFYRKFKKETRNFIEGIPKLGGPFAKLAQKLEEHLKGLLLPGVLFEEMGFNYIGPIDGHNIGLLIETFGRIKNSESPMLIHVITKKGRGYEFSEKDPSVFHGIGPFELETGEPLTGGVSYSDVFGRRLLELAGQDPSVVAISAAMKDATGLGPFAEKFPERFYDVGIAEPHAVTFAAGLAMGGMRPVVAIYSTFLQRAYDEIVHDVCLQNLPVVFAVDRAGIVGEDGPTHHGVFDISYLRHIPNLVFMSPKDAAELKAMLFMCLSHDGPSAIRYPRGKAAEAAPCSSFGIGEAEALKDGHDIAIMAIGNCVEPALLASERLKDAGIDAMVLNMRFIKPLDKKLLLYAAKKTRRIITVEDNVLMGGFGSAVMECLNGMANAPAGNGSEAGDLHGIRVMTLGLPDAFIEHGSQKELRGQYGIDEDGIYSAAVSLMREASSPV